MPGHYIRTLVDEQRYIGAVRFNTSPGEILAHHRSGEIRDVEHFGLALSTTEVQMRGSIEPGLPTRCLAGFGRVSHRLIVVASLKLAV